METLCQDIRYATRVFRSNLGFSAVVVLTLALDIGASTAIYSVVNRVLFDPIPGAGSERLVQIAERMYTHGNFKEENDKPFFCGVSPPVLEALLVNQPFFEELTWADGIQLERKTEDFIDVATAIARRRGTPTVFTSASVTGTNPILSGSLATTISMKWPNTRSSRGSRKPATAIS